VTDTCESHFDSPSARCRVGSFASPGYPGFAFSMAIDFWHKKTQIYINCNIFNIKNNSLPKVFLHVTLHAGSILIDDSYVITTTTTSHKRLSIFIAKFTKTPVVQGGEDAKNRFMEFEVQRNGTHTVSH